MQLRLEALGADLTEEERTFVARCDAFARDVIAPSCARFDRENRFAREVHDAARPLGLLDAGFPRALGGGGLSALALCRGARLLARACAPTAFSMVFNHGALRPVMFAGTPAQQQRLVGGTLARGGYASWCMTERDVSGSNLLATRARADRTDGGWRLTADKVMTGNGAVASLYFVLASAFDGDTPLGPTIFAVPRGAGVTVGENTDKLGFRCLPTVDVRFDDVHVPDDDVIGGVGDGVRVLVDSLDMMRFGGGIVTLGLTEGALLELLPWLEEREVYGGVRLVDDTHAQVTLGGLVAEAASLETLLEAAARRIDAGASIAREAAVLKLLGSDLAQRATAAAVQWHGWRGIDGAYGTQKRFRDARQTSIYEGTNDVLAMGLFRGFVRDARTARDDAGDNGGSGA